MPESQTKDITEAKEQSVQAKLYATMPTKEIIDKSARNECGQ